VRRALGERTVRQIEGRETREEREQRQVESGYGLEGYEAPEEIWFNHNQQRELEGQRMGEPGLLEAPPETALTEQAVVATEDGDADADGEGNGIFSGSTLAALKGYASASTANANARPIQSATAAPSTGPLVGYGSDDESD